MVPPPLPPERAAEPVVPLPLPPERAAEPVEPVFVRRTRSLVVLSVTVSMPSVCEIGIEVPITVELNVSRRRRSSMDPAESEEVEASLILQDGLLELVHEDNDIQNLSVGASERRTTKQFIVRPIGTGTSQCAVLFYERSQYAGEVSLS